MKISLLKYGSVISDQKVGDQIYTEIKSVINSHNKCVIDLTDVKSMATFNAKQIFGKLYLELGSEGFFNIIEIQNASNDLKLIIRLGIQSAVDDSISTC